MFEALVIVLAGLLAGTINTVVGSGTLITFPTLLFFGYAPVAANVSNTWGLVAAAITGAWGYRREIRETRHQIVQLLPMSIIGSIIGALLLLALPAAAFDAIVPVLIALALLLVVFGGRLNAWAQRHRVEAETGTKTGGAATGAVGGPALSRGRRLALLGGVFFGGIYGGYFGAAQGVLVMGVMNVLLPLSLQHLNAIKNILTPCANLVAAIVFFFVARDQINWAVAGLIALGAFGGGWVGARVGRSLSPQALRATIVVIGLVAIAKLVVFP
nr:sulfite exporter TauE/SafE family protein [Arsenicicoccus piscis]